MASEEVGIEGSVPDVVEVRDFGVNGQDSKKNIEWTAGIQLPGYIVRSVTQCVIREDLPVYES